MTLLALTPWQMAALLAVVAALVTWLFFRHMPRPEIVVPSILLWQRALGARAKSQRFHQMLSFLAALAIALCIAGALGHPIVGRQQPLGDTTIVLDTSPTMATRTADGSTRWEHAQREALELVESAASSDRIVVMDTRGRLRSPRHGTPADAARALREMAVDAAIDRTVSNVATDRVFFVSDGVLTKPPRGATPLSVFEPADNVGVTAFRVRPLLAGAGHEAYVEVVNFSERAQAVHLTIGTGARELLRRELQLGAGEAFKATFELPPSTSGIIRVRAEAERDALALDDAAMAYVAPARRVRVAFAGDRSGAVGRALALDSRVELVAGDADAYVVEGNVPAKLPGKPVLLVKPSTVPAICSLIGVIARPALGDIVSHPILDSVQFDQVRLQEAGQYRLTGAAHVLAGSSASPLIAIGDSPARWVLLAFDPERSGMGRDAMFPILMHNIVSWLSMSATGISVPPGIVEVRVADARVTDEDGRQVPSYAVDASALDVSAIDASAIDASTVFAAPRAGTYIASGGGQRVYVAVNTTSRSVSNVNASVFREATGRPRARGGETIDLWRHLLVLAFALLVADSWLLRRRAPVNRLDTT